MAEHCPGMSNTPYKEHMHHCDEEVIVIESQRGKHPEYVFTYKGECVVRVNNHAWRRARDCAGLPLARVHDLRYTFGHRLRATGVGFEDRQDFLGHRSGRITTHYSAPNVSRLLDAVNSI